MAAYALEDIPSVTLDCPHCTRAITVETKATPKQRAAIAALLEPENRTQNEAAAQAGITPQHLSILLKSVQFQVALQKARENRADSAKDALSKIVLLKERALNKLIESATANTMDVATAAGILKIVQDAHGQELRIREMIGDPTEETATQQAARIAWSRCMIHAGRVAHRIGRRYGSQRLRELESAIPERVERRALRSAAPQDVVVRPKRKVLSPPHNQRVIEESAT